jgi:alkylation response protein AidB-like acyl-CoA dehydrogenase/3-oxoacyl-(acyl-carrier-protein) synthase/acyl carrier protein
MPHDIALVGMSCRFPGAAHPTEFWDLLSAGCSAIREVPPERWSARRIYDPDPAVPGKASTRWGGFLEAPGAFDNDFFRMTAEESTYVDPQQRLMLELGWEALEDAGIAPDSLAGQCAGVYVGISHNDYERIIYRRLEDITRFHGTGSYQAVAANRLSYFLNLVGPSVAVDSACSSALSALHMACAALRQGEVGLALVGAVTYHLTPDETIGLTKGRMLSGHGSSRPFDKQADGYVRGEGGGVLVAKRLEDAVREGDRVLGVVKGTAINHNGRSNGLSAPSSRALQAVFEQALACAGVPASAVSFLETHGTGTKLGDQIELNAIREVYGRPGAPLRLGASKGNIGHLETSSGMASLIKVLLSMEHGRIPANIYPSTPELLPLPAGSRIAFPLAADGWPADTGPRIAAVTSYGFGGANGHVILADAPAQVDAADVPVDGPDVLCLSARDAEAVAVLAGRYLARFDEEALRPAHVCFTASIGRSHFESRLAIVFDGVDDLRRQLAEAAVGSRAPQTTLRDAQSVFVFSPSTRAPCTFVAALGSRYAIFRDTFEQCGALDARRAAETSVDARAAERIDGFALQLGLARLLAAWGVEPDAVRGAGDGRLAAAVFAGAIELEDAVRLLSGERFLPAWRDVALPVLDLDGQPLPPDFALNAAATDGDASASPMADAGGVVIGTADGDGRQAMRALLDAIASAYMRGARINWAAFHAGTLRRKLRLPTYPFQRKLRWFADLPLTADDAAAPVPAPVEARPLRAESTAAPVSDAVGARARELAEWLRAYAATRLDSRTMDERRCMPPHLVLDLGNAGLLGLLVPRRWGGEELSMRDAVHVFEQLGAIDITLAAFIGVHNVLGVLPLLRGGSDALKAELLPRMASGRLLGAFAVTEPGAGSNPRGMAATARPAAGGGLRLDGHKTWIGNAAWSGVLTTFVNEYDAQGAYAGISGFVTTPDTPGVIQGPESMTLGVRAMVQNDVLFRDARVSEEQRVGRPGDGLAIASETFDVGRLGIGALTVGASKRCLQLLLRFGARRRVSTGWLADNGVFLATLRTISARTEMIQSWVRCLARLRDEGVPVPSEAHAVAKVGGSEWLWQAVDATMQFMGGRGYVETNLVPQMWRDARLLRIFEGPTEALLAHVGAALVKGRSGLQVFLAERFAGPCAAKVALRLQALAQAVGRATTRGLPAERIAVLQQGAGWAQCVGAMLCAAEAGVAVADRGAVLEVGWREFDESVRVVEAFLSSAPLVAAAAADVRAHAAALAGEIGDVDQRSARDMDELLKPDAPSPVPAPVSTPTAAVPVRVEPVALPPAPQAPRAPASGLRETVLALFAKRLRVRPEAIDPDRPFFEYGVDSVGAVEIALEIESSSGITLDATALWNFPTLNALLRHLAPPASRPSPAETPAAAASAQASSLAGQSLLDELRKELASDRA